MTDSSPRASAAPDSPGGDARTQGHTHANPQANTQAPTRIKRVVLDTDAANEIDDQFALAWALRSPHALRVEGVYAAPFSHGRYFEALARANHERPEPEASDPPISDFERIAAAIPPAELTALLVRTSPELGMEKSFEEILRVFEAAQIDPGNRVQRGARGFLVNAREPIESEAVEHLIALARTARPDDPIHVAVIGAPTNIASALLLAPEIADRLVIVLVAGYASGLGLVDDSFNLIQDRLATNVVLASEARLVYLPGYQVAEILQLALPAARAWLGDDEPLARFLLERFEHNPINPRVAEPGRSWVLWDMATIAWLLDPDWVATRRVPRARVDAAHRWQPLPMGSGTMLEGVRVKRNEIFADFLARLLEARD